MDNDIKEMDIRPLLQMGLEIPGLYIGYGPWHFEIYRLEGIEDGKAIYVNTGRCSTSLDDLPRVLGELGMTPQAKELVA